MYVYSSVCRQCRVFAVGLLQSVRLRCGCETVERKIVTKNKFGSRTWNLCTNKICIKLVLVA